jgi:hypothetical protein
MGETAPVLSTVAKGQSSPELLGDQRLWTHPRRAAKPPARDCHESDAPTTTAIAAPTSHLYQTTKSRTFLLSCKPNMAGLKTIIALSFVCSAPSPSPPNHHLDAHELTRPIRCSQLVSCSSSSRRPYGITTYLCWSSRPTLSPLSPTGSAHAPNLPMTSWMEAAVLSLNLVASSLASWSSWVLVCQSAAT